MWWMSLFGCQPAESVVNGAPTAEPLRLGAHDLTTIEPEFLTRNGPVHLNPLDGNAVLVGRMDHLIQEPIQDFSPWIIDDDSRSRGRLSVANPGGGGIGSPYGRLAATGDVNGDGHTDALLSAGALFRVPRHSKRSTDRCSG